MNLQNLKNYLIFIIAVSHMLTHGYEAEEQVSKEKSDNKVLRTTPAIKRMEHTLAKKPTTNHREETPVIKVEKEKYEVQLQQPSAPKIFHGSSDFFIGNPYEKRLTSNE